MPDLLIRPTGLDGALLAKALTPVAGRRSAELVVRPRLVVDAVTAARHREFSDTARVAGIPMLVDPETYYLQDFQHASDRWASLPFARRAVMTVSDLSADVQRKIVEAAFGHQIRCNATHLMIPYLHMKSVNDGWAERQISLFRVARSVLDQRDITLPTVAVIDLNWRLLERHTWSEVLLPLLAAADTAGFDEIALAGSNVDGGVRPADRAAALIATIEQAVRTAPVIAWNQGLLGELCVTAGASGYGTGIGWREKWDTAARMRDRRIAREPGPMAPRPVYVRKLGRSIPKKTIEQLISRRAIAPDLACPPGGCCRDGATGLLADSRWHTLYGRVASLRELADTDRRFQWAELRTRAEHGLDLAQRINTVATREGLARVDDAALRAILACATVAHQSRQSRVA